MPPRPAVWTPLKGRVRNVRALQSKAKGDTMAIGQRKRQRLNRKRSRARLGDVAALTLRPGMGSLSAVADRWRECGRGDLRRLRQAIAGGWLDGNQFANHREVLADAAYRVVEQPKTTRHLLRAANAIVEMDVANLRHEDADSNARDP